MAAPADIGGLERAQSMFRGIDQVAMEIERIEHRQGPVGGHTTRANAAGHRYPGQFARETLVVAQVCEHSAAFDPIELLVWEWQLIQWAGGDPGGSG
jgi:hypothetical protein